MEALKVIGWAAWVGFATLLVFQFVGFRTMTEFFPEGKRAWHLPAQFGTLAFFAAAVLCNPWK
jgi:polyferredoxin